MKGKWVEANVPTSQKNPRRSGPYKLAYGNRMVFVYGTKGTPEENEWAQNKARFDSETWYYRGNGAVDVMSDDRARSMRLGNRNVILYGNADTNGLWNNRLRSAPIQVRRDRVEAGTRILSGPGFSSLFLYPFGGGEALTGVVSGTGIQGLRTTDRLPVFTSGVAYTDWIVLGSDALSRGPKGAIGAGFFNNEWKLDPAQSAWSTEK